jgi:hypothetical protein
MWTVAQCPSNFLSFSTLPPPPSLVKVQYIQTVCGWEGVGVLSPIGDHNLQEFNTPYVTRFRTYKMLDHPKQKPSSWEDLRQINTCRKVPLQVNFFRWRHFALAIAIGIYQYSIGVSDTGKKLFSFEPYFCTRHIQLLKISLTAYCFEESKKDFIPCTFKLRK